MDVNLTKSHAAELEPLLNVAQNKSEGQLVRTTTKGPAAGWSSSSFSIKLLLAAAIAIALSFVGLDYQSRQSRSLAELHPFDYAARTQRLLSRYGIFDGHNDLVCKLRVTHDGAWSCAEGGGQTSSGSSSRTRFTTQPDSRWEKVC